jgi:predicted transcriptional regulator
MATMTLNLSDREMAVVEALAEEQEMSKTALIKQALRTYQLIIKRIKAGETIHFSGDRERIIEFVGPGFNTDL